ncbi:ATP-NAD kinase-like domain-containing protein, partial [Entophlyctis helioformis]
LSYHLGSLGFLTVFDITDIRNVLERIVGCTSDGVRVNMRMRLNCTVHRHSRNKADKASLISSSIASPYSSHPASILNDLVVDRGPSPYMSQLELFVEDKHLTTVQADGLVVATPTGSTAYSLSAGGSLVHPEVPSFLITPICAHTLSFRPMLLPDSIVLKLQVPLDSRNTAWASFDGRHRTELRQGDYISVTMSRWPMPSVCMEDQSSDWFESLRRCLHWNERARQKPFGIPGDIDTSVTDAELGADGSLESPSVGQVSLEDMAVRLFNLGRL